MGDDRNRTRPCRVVFKTTGTSTVLFLKKFPGHATTATESSQISWAERWHISAWSPNQAEVGRPVPLSVLLCTWVLYAKKACSISLLSLALAPKEASRKRHPQHRRERECQGAATTRAAVYGLGMWQRGRVEMQSRCGD